MIRTWWKLASLALAVALAVPSLVGQAKLTPADLTLKKSLGSPIAPIKIEIFSDYQCPACREMHLNTTRQVIDNYVSSGKVYLVHRDFPLGHAPVLSRGRALAERRCRRRAPSRPPRSALYTKQDHWGLNGNVEQTLANSLPAAEMSKVRAMELSQRAQLDAAVQSDVNLGNHAQRQRHARASSSFTAARPSRCPRARCRTRCSSSISIPCWRSAERTRWPTPPAVSDLRRPASPALPADHSADRPHRSWRALSLRRLCQAALRRRLAPARLPFPLRLRHQLLRDALARKRAPAGSRPALGGSCSRHPADYRHCPALGRLGSDRAAYRVHVRPGPRRVPEARKSTAAASATRAPARPGS